MSPEMGVALVVDDDLLVRRIAVAALERAGLRCLDAASADAALRLVLELHGHLSVLVTDVEMPGVLDGIGLAVAVAESSPGVPVVVMSSEPAQLARAVGIRSVVATVDKPFAPAGLAGTVLGAACRAGARTPAGRARGRQPARRLVAQAAARDVTAVSEAPHDMSMAVTMTGQSRIVARFVRS